MSDPSRTSGGTGLGGPVRGGCRTVYVTGSAYGGITNLWRYSSINMSRPKLSKTPTYCLSLFRSRDTHPSPNYDHVGEERDGRGSVGEGPGTGLSFEVLPQVEESPLEPHPFRKVHLLLLEAVVGVQVEEPTVDHDERPSRHGCLSRAQSFA